MLLEKKLIDEFLNGAVTQVKDQLNEPRETIYKYLEEEDKVGKNSNYDVLMNICQCEYISSNEDELTKFEKELKFLEAWLERPCFNEASIEAATMNVEDNMDDVENEDINEIFIYGSPKEIKHYYGLIWELSFGKETIDEENELVEKGVEIYWHHPSCNKKKYLIS